MWTDDEQAHINSFEAKIEEYQQALKHYKDQIQQQSSAIKDQEQDLIRLIAKKYHFQHVVKKWPRDTHHILGMLIACIGQRKSSLTPTYIKALCRIIGKQNITAYLMDNDIKDNNSGEQEDSEDR